MTEKNLPEDLDEIKKSLEETLERLDEIKQNADTQYLPEIEKIERTGWQTIVEIDDLSKRFKKTKPPLKIDATIPYLPPGTGKPYTMKKIGRFWA